MFWVLKYNTYRDGGSVIVQFQVSGIEYEEVIDKCGSCPPEKHITTVNVIRSYAIGDNENKLSMTASWIPSPVTLDENEPLALKIKQAVKVYLEQSDYQLNKFIKED